MIQFEKNKREHVRWLILLTLDHARPIGAAESLVELRGRDTARWHAKLTSEGVDFVEYTTGAINGIARPEKYW